MPKPKRSPHNTSAEQKKGDFSYDRAVAVHRLAAMKIMQRHRRAGVWAPLSLLPFPSLLLEGAVVAQTVAVAGGGSFLASLCTVRSFVPPCRACHCRCCRRGQFACVPLHCSLICAVAGYHPPQPQTQHVGLGILESAALAMPFSHSILLPGTSMTRAACVQGRIPP